MTQSPDTRLEPRSGRMAWHLKQAEARATAAKVVEALRRFATHMEYDCPGDTPEPCGMWCDICQEHISEDACSGHAEDCLLSDHPAPEPGVEASIRECLLRLKNECEIDGLDAKAGFDAWLSWANRLLGTTPRRALQTPANGGRDGE